MTLAELRFMVRDLVQDRYGQAFSEAEILRPLNLAYRLVLDLQSLATPQDQTLFLYVDPIPVTVVSTQRVYVIDPGGIERSTGLAIRRIVNAIPRPGTGAGSTRAYPIRPYGYFDGVFRGPGPRRARRRPTPDGIYVWRESDEKWYLGLFQKEPDPVVLDVHFEAEVFDLAGESDEPLYVPRRWHHLIAYKAAIVLKGIEKRDATELRADAQAIQAAMLVDMERIFGASMTRSRRI